MCAPGVAQYIIQYVPCNTGAHRVYICTWGGGGVGSAISCTSECYNGTDFDVECIALGQLGLYKAGTVHSKSFVGKDFLQNKWKYELTMQFQHEMIGK